MRSIFNLCPDKLSSSNCAHILYVDYTAMGFNNIRKKIIKYIICCYKDVRRMRIVFRYLCLAVSLKMYTLHSVHENCDDCCDILYVLIYFALQIFPRIIILQFIHINSLPVILSTDTDETECFLKNYTSFHTCYKMRTPIKKKIKVNQTPGSKFKNM